MIKNKRWYAIIFISLFFGLLEPLYSEDTTPVPYNTEEFPQSLKDLRRFEIITLGAMPFVTLDVTLGYSAYKWYTGSATDGNILGKQNYTPEEQKKIIITSLCISAGVGLSDFTVRLIKRLSAEKKAKQKEKSILITPISEDPEAIKLNNPYEQKDEIITDEVIIDEVETLDVKYEENFVEEVTE